MFRATRRIMADAMATGIADAVDNDGAPMPSETFLNNLRHSAEVFSAFRVHKMQTDVASQMVDANGKLKTFAQFRKDVEPYVSHRNRAWLRTEYDTAVIRAHQATDWQQFESEKDVFPNLEWIPSTSPHPGADHQVFWGTVRPVNDSFWSEHRPGDRWNCKCELRQTEADATIPPMPTDADNPQPGLENNPGRDGELFSQKHPYYPSGCMSCPFAGGHLAALMHGLAHKQDCHQCEKVNKVITSAKGEKTTRLTSEEKRQIRTKYEDFVRTLPAINVGGDISHRKDVTTTGGETIRVGRNFFSETFAKNSRNPQLKKTMDLAMDFEKWMPTLLQGQIENGIDHSFQFKAYEFRYNGYDIVFKAKLTEGLIAYTMRIKKETTPKAEGSNAAS